MAGSNSSPRLRDKSKTAGGEELEELEELEGLARTGLSSSRIIRYLHYAVHISKHTPYEI